MNFLDIIFPEKCLYCGKYGKYICKNCFNKLDNKFLFKKVENEYFNYLVCCSIYQGKIRIQMHNFKFHEQSYLYKYFVELILNNHKICNFLKKFDLITYVPMSIKRENSRGYNQSKLLAKELGKNMSIEVCNLLKKVKENKTQSSLSKKEREFNVKDVYQFFQGFDIKNKNIVLVDDIFTTGSTVKACSKILKENGANKICVLTISVRVTNGCP